METVVALVVVALAAAALVVIVVRSRSKRPVSTVEWPPLRPTPVVAMPLRYPGTTDLMRLVAARRFAPSAPDLVRDAEYEAAHGGALRVLAGRSAAVFPLEARPAAHLPRQWVLRIPLAAQDDSSLARYRRLSAMPGDQRSRLGLPLVLLVEEAIVWDEYPEAIPAQLIQRAQGTELGTYISHHARDRNALLALAVSFRDYLFNFESEGFAHGDLRDRNVFVSPMGRITFIDLDDSYLPGLARGSGEGHPNFQHPRLAPRHWGPGVDSFSALLIWTALRAIAFDAALFDEFEDDESILFKKKDLVNPGRSPLWGRLAASPDERVRAAAITLAGCCRKEDPPLQGFRTLLP